MLIQHDVTVDFMDMTDDRRLWARQVDIRPGLALVAGDHVTVGDDGADARVARVVEIDADGLMQLQVLPGSLEANAAMLTLDH